MFEEAKDLTTAEDMFSKMYKEVSSELKKKLFKVFLKSVLKSYEAKKRYASSELQIENPIWGLNVLNHVHGILILLIDERFAKKYSEERKVDMLGESLGDVLAVVEFHIANKKTSFLTYPGLRNKTPENYSEQLIAALNEIKSDLNLLGKDVKVEYIKTRVNLILRRSGKDLSPQQKSLLTKIAAVFAN